MAATHSNSNSHFFCSLALLLTLKLRFTPFPVHSHLKIQYICYVMKKISAICILYYILLNSGAAQIINRSVINYAGSSYNSMFTFSAGEAIVGSEVHSLYADKGFIQPIFKQSSIGIQELEYLYDKTCNISSPVTADIFVPDKSEDVVIFDCRGMRMSNLKPIDGIINASIMKSGLYIIVYRLNHQLYSCKFLVIEQ